MSRQITTNPSFKHPIPAQPHSTASVNVNPNFKYPTRISTRRPYNPVPLRWQLRTIRMQAGRVTGGCDQRYKFINRKPVVFEMSAKAAQFCQFSTPTLQKSLPEGFKSVPTLSLLLSIKLPSPTKRRALCNRRPRAATRRLDSAPRGANTSRCRE